MSVDLNGLLFYVGFRQQQHLNAALAAFYLNRNGRRARRRQYWVRPWIGRRLEFGDYDNLMQELEREARGDFVGFLRMEPQMFRELLARLTPRLTKRDTNFRKALKPGLKLAIALRYMASGNSYRSLAFSFRVAHNSISIIVKEVAVAIAMEYEQERASTRAAPPLQYYPFSLLLSSAF